MQLPLFAHMSPPLHFSSSPSFCLHLPSPSLIFPILPLFPVFSLISPLLLSLAEAVKVLLGRPKGTFLIRPHDAKEEEFLCFLSFVGMENEVSVWVEENVFFVFLIFFLLFFSLTFSYFPYFILFFVLFFCFLVFLGH